MSASSTLQDLRSRAAEFWQQRDPRERKILAAAGVFLVAVFIWLLLLDPAITGIARLNKSLPALRQQAAEMQGLASQAGQVGRQAVAAPAPLTRESLDAAIARHNLKAGNVQVNGELARVSFTNASFAAIVNLQDELQRGQRVLVQEATVEALEAADMVNATLTLRQQAPAQ